MALRLRRGTNLQRQTFVLDEGELIYVTDTKELYAGDGITLGGILITGDVAGSPAVLTKDLNLNGYDILGTGTITSTFIGDGSGINGILLELLEDVLLMDPGNGDILKYVDGLWTNAPETVSEGGGTGIIEGLQYNISIKGDVVGADSNVLVDSVLGVFNGNVTGNLTGNADTATALADARSFSLTGDVTATAVTFDGTGNVELTTVYNPSPVALGTDTTGDYVASLTQGTGVTITNNSGEGATPTIDIGQAVATTDNVTFNNVTADGNIITSGYFKAGIYTSVEREALTPDTGTILFDNTDDGRLYLFTGGQWTKILGEGVDSGGTELTTFLKLGSYDTVTRDEFGTDSNLLDGVIFYNTDSDRVEIFQAGSWVNIPNNGTAIGEVLTWNGSEWAAALAASGGDVVNSQQLGNQLPSFYLDYNNFTNTPTLFDGAFSSLSSTPTTLSGYGITDAVLSTDLGNFTFTGSVLDSSDSSGITITPAVTVSSDLTVENNLTVTNTVYAERFESTATGTPSIEAATNLDLTAGNAVRITSSVLRLASFTTTERDALAAQNGDLIYNTTDNKFQGYENGAWANLI
tara:strand:+ start:1704 stop:3443 length:1740 start_codon:yes stop_codon:yes gene_type:complete